MSVNKLLESQNKALDIANKLTSSSKIFDSEVLKQLSTIKIQVPEIPVLKFENPLSEISDRYLEWVKPLKKFSAELSEMNTLYDYKYLDVQSIVKNFNSLREYDFSDVIKEYHFDEEDGSNDRQIVLNETSRIQKIITGVYLNNEELYSIKPREFEEVIAELLYNKGFKVELTKQTRDNGYDILALKYLDSFSPIKYLVECKRFNSKRKVGVEIIRSFKEVIQTEQANKGLIFTTSYFTRGAENKRLETPYLLDYKNKDEVIEWVNDYYNSLILAY